MILRDPSNSHLLDSSKSCVVRTRRLSMRDNSCFELPSLSPMSANGWIRSKGNKWFIRIENLGFNPLMCPLRLHITNCLFLEPWTSLFLERDENALQWPPQRRIPVEPIN
jgi:hypothetical protein